MFESKKILFISPKFFNYEREIIDKLESMGAIVTYFDDRPSNMPIAKALMRVQNPLKSIWVNYHYRKILNEIRNKKYDFFLLIKGEVTPGFFLKGIRELFENTKFIYYSYDSVLNNANAINNLSYFDTKISFDLEDSSIFSLQFRPLFFLDDYALLKSKEADIDLLFIGTAHTDRYLIVKKLLNSVKSKTSKKISHFFFFYLQGHLLYHFKKLTDKSFSAVDIEDVSFKPLGKDEVLNLVDRSNCIIDIQHPNQTGLTIRTIECLGARKKLISTNKSIINYDFYNDNNICIVDRDSPEIPLSFLMGKYENIDSNIYNYYSIDSWVKYVFN